MFKKIASILAVTGIAISLAACNEDDARVASYNISKAADNFEIMRRIVFYNTWTDSYMLEIVGLCSIQKGFETKSVAIICKTGPDSYKKHYLGLNKHVTWFAEQIEAKSVSAYHYRVTFKPQSIIPDVDVRVDTKELMTDRH